MFPVEMKNPIECKIQKKKRILVLSILLSFKIKTSRQIKQKRNLLGSSLKYFSVLSFVVAVGFRKVIINRVEEALKSLWQG